MTNSFNMGNWRHKYITMSEIANEAVEVDSGYYDRNRATILASLEREHYSSEDAEQIFDTMKTDGLTQDEAIAAWNEMKADYEGEKGGDREDDIMPDDLMEEDIDLGHEDDEPHMIKAELYRIGKYAMELYKMVDQFEGEQEVDFPHWWQAKIIEAKNMLVSAKHYLDFEIKEPQLDAMVDVASEEGVINDKPMMENIGEDAEEKKGHYVTIKSKDGTQKVTIKNLPNHVNKTYKGALSSIEDLKSIDGRKGKKYIYYVSDINGNPIDPPVDVASEEGAIDEEMTSEKSRKIGMPFKNKIKEAILAKLKNQTPVDENIFTGRNDMHMGSSYSDYSSNSDISIDILASKIAKALKNPKNQNEDDQNNIKQARKALNLGDIKVAEKIETLNLDDIWKF